MDEILTDFNLLSSLVSLSSYSISIDDGQPEIGLAPYPKPFKVVKESKKPDKHHNTYETDPEFLNFKLKKENPEAYQVKTKDKTTVHRSLYPFLIISSISY